MGYFFNKYKREIESNWYFDKIKKEALSNCFIDDDENIIASCFLGSVFSIYPSGKYWTWWACSNVDIKEQIKDRAFSEALETVFEDKGFWITGGECDPCDLFVQFIVDLDDVEKLGVMFITSEDHCKYQELLQD